MGLEVRWHLVYDKRDDIDVLVAKKDLPQLEAILYTVSGWRMETELRGENVLAHFRRGGE